jgi:glycosyltransferase involved in cell wall biosynthesis
MLRLAYLVSHPIQYQAPLLRRIAREPEIDLTVLFGSDFSVRGYKDEGFGVEVAWDTPLLEGYKSEFLKSWRDTGTVSFTSPFSRGLYRRLQELQPDALWVHGYASLNALQGILAANALGIPVLLRAESWLGDRPRSPLKLAAKSLLLRALGPAIDAVLPIGTLNAAYWRHYFTPRLSGDTVPQFLMPYAVDNDWFAARAAASDPAALRAELDLDPGRPVILFASKLQPRKHADHLLAAFHSLSNLGAPDRNTTGVGAPGLDSETWVRVSGANHQLPYLLFVGDGEERTHLEQQAADLGITDRVRFAGFRNQSELPAFFRLASVFVLPSQHEPWGLIVNEAMACGCPVIVSSDVGCHPDLVPVSAPELRHLDRSTRPYRVRSGETPVLPGVPSIGSDRWGTGIVYPVGDIPALTAALRRVLATPETSSRMGAAARARISTWSFEQDIAGLRAALAHTTGKLRP